MVAPVRGPYSSRTQFDGLKKTLIWYRQRPPFDKRLPLTSDIQIRLPGSSGSTDHLSWNVTPLTYDPSGLNLALQKARNRFVYNFSGGDMASLGAATAEYRSAFSMIENRALQLLSIAKAMKRGNVHELPHLFSQRWNKPMRRRSKPHASAPSGRQRAKDLGSLWLEYWFGWAPLVNDIGTAVEVLQRKIPLDTFKGRGSYTNTAKSGTSPRYEKTITYKVQVIAEVAVTNPNLYLANQLGFINPAVVLWEIVPFSFVVDWFANVGQFLRQWTDLAGVTLSNPATTYYAELIWHEYWNPSTQRHKKRVQIERSAGIANFSLRPIARFNGLSPTRGASAISLLLQQLRS